jgi:hypothetical protein
MSESDDDVEALTPEEEQAVSALLASLPAEPMPPEVLARIEEALAREPALIGSAAPVLPSLETARQRRNLHGPLLFRVAASVVGVAVAFGVGLIIVESGGPGSSAGTSAAGAPSVPAAADSTARAASGSTAAGSTAASASASNEFGIRVLRTGRTYDAANLATQAIPLIAGVPFQTLAPAAASTAASSAAVANGPGKKSAVPSRTGLPATSAPHPISAGQLVDSPTLLAACVSELADRDGRSAIAVDIGSWAGAPAVIVVLPPAAGTSDLEVFAVRPSCGQVNDSSDVLDFASLTVESSTAK